MSKIWLTSDEHYGHEKIIQYCNRPWKDTKAMTAAMIANHNALVAPDDIVFHLGDVFWGDNWKQLAGILKRLNGKHHLILGNHDWMYVWYYVEAGFLSVHTMFDLEAVVLVHDPAVATGLKDRLVVHGHTHELGKHLSDNTYCVCVELHNYAPVSLDTVISEHYGRSK